METSDERDCLQQMFWDEDSGNGRNINPLWKEGDDDPYSLVLSSLPVSLTSYSTWKCIQRGSKQIAIWNLNISVSKLFWSRKYLNRDVCGAGTNGSPKPGFQTPGPNPDSFGCSDMLGTQPEELILPLSVLWPTCHFCLTKRFYN